MHDACRGAFRGHRVAMVPKKLILLQILCIKFGYLVHLIPHKLAISDHPAKYIHKLLIFLIFIHINS